MSILQLRYCEGATSYKATSHWSGRDARAGVGAMPTKARVVRYRYRLGCADVMSGLEFGLMMAPSCDMASMPNASSW